MDRVRQAGRRDRRAPADLVAEALVGRHLPAHGHVHVGHAPPSSGAGASRVHSTTASGSGSPDATPSANRPAGRSAGGRGGRGPQPGGPQPTSGRVAPAASAPARNRRRLVAGDVASRPAPPLPASPPAVVVLARQRCWSSGPSPVVPSLAGPGPARLRPVTLAAARWPTGCPHGSRATVGRPAMRPVRGKADGRQAMGYGDPRRRPPLATGSLVLWRARAEFSCVTCRARMLSRLSALSACSLTRLQPLFYKHV